MTLLSGMGGHSMHVKEFSGYERPIHVPLRGVTGPGSGKLSRGCWGLVVDHSVEKESEKGVFCWGGWSRGGIMEVAGQRAPNGEVRWRTPLGRCMW